MKQLGLPLPAAITPGSPMSDLTGVGDSFTTNAMVDNVLVSREGCATRPAQFYAHGHDLKDPLLSPVYGDLHGFPPAILTTGTRDLLLSNTVRVHREVLRQTPDQVTLKRKRLAPSPISSRKAKFDTWDCCRMAPRAGVTCSKSEKIVR